MKKTALLLALCIVGAVCTRAQDGTKKTEPVPTAKSSDKPATAERPKDDATTAKDPAIVAIDKFIVAEFPGNKPDRWRTSLKVPPKLTFTKDAQYEWHLKTNKGNITIRLMPDVAPMHVSSTIYLARLGFYDGLKFHRVIPGFMAQGGDPLGSGSGGPGYQYSGEFDPKAKHDKAGILSMAHAGPGTDGSQFFITFGPTPDLDNKHTVFGEMTSGMDALKKLEAAGSSPSGKTSEPLIIEQSWIVVAPPPPAEKPATPPATPPK
jgi:cyclophilin family peptidyl-prolyl cis-trans isomerase